MQAETQSSVIFCDDAAGRERRFVNPETIIEAWDPSDFFPALEALEAARSSGKWLAGYFSYEAGYLLEPKLRPLLPEDRKTPLLCFGVFDKQTTNPAQQSPPPSNGPIADARARWTFKDYEPRFETLHNHLRRGSCYQGNLTFPIDAVWTGNPLDAFHSLALRQPVRFSALVRLGEPIILSRSPELFFEVDRKGWIRARPMKGTAPRGHTQTEDARNRRFLRSDEKNQAENRMIVDLLRNDISRISEVGTLQVTELFRIETYATVLQMVSTVRAKLRPDLSIQQIFEALFPCGSITGAPKIRAMEILRELEERPRDAYCGAIGWIAPDGRMRFNVAIRTITLFADGHATYNVGGGVVFDSDAESEYRECLLKARFATGMEPATT